jgi:hypothetical protein
MANYPNAPTYSGVDFSWLANLPDQYYKGAKDKQQYDLSHAFQNGLPKTQDGQIDYATVANLLAKYGDYGNTPQLEQLAQQQS